jgi:hypothetical protein
MGRRLPDVLDHDPREPQMMWAGDRQDGTGRITYITNAFEPCE